MFNYIVQNILMIFFWFSIVMVVCPLLIAIISTIFTASTSSNKATLNNNRHTSNTCHTSSGWPHSHFEDYDSCDSENTDD